MMNAQIIEWHTDLDQSGGTMARPAFQQAYERALRKETGGLVVAKLDRFARSAADAGPGGAQDPGRGRRVRQRGRAVADRSEKRGTIAYAAARRRHRDLFSGAAAGNGPALLPAAATRSRCCPDFR
jgi:hypothetical protein